MTKLNGVLAVSADLMSGQRLWIRVVATAATVVAGMGWPCRVLQAEDRESA
jgi:hypothetical protein